MSTVASWQPKDTYGHTNSSSVNSKNENTVQRLTILPNNNRCSAWWHFEKCSVCCWLLNDRSFGSEKQRNITILGATSMVTASEKIISPVYITAISVIETCKWQVESKQILLLLFFCFLFYKNIVFFSFSFGQIAQRTYLWCWYRSNEFLS